MKKIENDIKFKLQRNFNNVRKAFLDMDADQDGQVTAEDFAKILKYGTANNTGSNKNKSPDTGPVDYSTLEFLIKLRTK